ncbi:MAG: hypothetical protein ACOCTG_00170, partial [Bacteroidota bacterium]
MRIRSRLVRRTGMLVVVSALSIAACQSQVREADLSVRSYLEGTVTISPDIDTTASYAGFEVIVGNEGPDGLDTLAFALTDAGGRFRTDVEAPLRGIYPILIAREGTILKVGQLVVGDGDSASFSVELPDRGQPWRIRSQENSSWVAFQNTRALHNQGVIDLLQEGEAGTEAMERQVMQAASILWGLRETFPGTVGGDVAAAESIVMLDGWDDELLVQRARAIEETNPRFMDVVRSARRAQARLNG